MSPLSGRLVLGQLLDGILSSSAFDESSDNQISYNIAGCVLPTVITQRSDTAVPLQSFVLMAIGVCAQGVPGVPRHTIYNAHARPMAATKTPTRGYNERHLPAIP